MLVLAIDPGGVTRKSEKAHAGTGLAVLSTDNGKLELLEARQVLWTEWAMGQAIQDYLVRYDLDKVVYEDFIPRYGVPFSLDPVKLIGAIRATVEPDMLVHVAPSAHKSLIKREWAKSLVLESGHLIEEGHKIDAASLALYYNVVSKNEATLKELAKWLKSK